MTLLYPGSSTYPGPSVYTSDPSFVGGILTATGRTDADPCPRIEVLISPMPAGTESVTVWRNYGGFRSIVPGANDTPVSGDHLVIDLWAPLGVEVTYTCQTRDADGLATQLSDRSNPVTLDVPQAWLQDPVLASSCMPVGYSRPGDAVLRAGSFAEVTRSAAVNKFSPFGSILPLASAQARQEPSQIPLDIRTVEPATTALRSLIKQAFPLLLRTDTRVPQIPRLAYLAITDMVERLQPDKVTTLWSGTGDTVAPPGPSIQLAIRTYDDLAGEASSYDDLAALYDTYIDMARGS